MSIFHEKISLAVGLCVASAAAFAPGVAHAGFFDQLFGMPQVAPPQPAYVQPYSAPVDDGVHIPRAHHRRHVVVALSSQKQTPTDLMHDKTLRAGDAVMTKHGIEVYEGDRGSVHDQDEFVKLGSDPEVERSEKVALLAMDSARADRPSTDLAANEISTGRSAALSSPLAQGYKITDPRGRAVRYVGP